MNVRKYSEMIMAMAIHTCACNNIKNDEQSIEFSLTRKKFVILYWTRLDPHAKCQPNERRAKKNKNIKIRKGKLKRMSTRMCVWCSVIGNVLA